MPGGTSVCPNSMSVFKTTHLFRENGKTATSSSKPSGGDGCNAENLLVKIPMICRSPSPVLVIMRRSTVTSRSFKSDCPVNLDTFGSSEGNQSAFKSFRDRSLFGFQHVESFVSVSQPQCYVSTICGFFRTLPR